MRRLAESKGAEGDAHVQEPGVVDDVGFAERRNLVYQFLRVRVDLRSVLDAEELARFFLQPLLTRLSTNSVSAESSREKGGIRTRYFAYVRSHRALPPEQSRKTCAARRSSWLRMYADASA